MTERTPVVIEISALREMCYTGIPNVVAELCARFLLEEQLDLYFALSGLWVDSNSLRTCWPSAVAQAWGQSSTGSVRPRRSAAHSRPLGRCPERLHSTPITGRRGDCFRAREKLSMISR